MIEENRGEEREGNSSGSFEEMKSINICTACLAMNMHGVNKCHYCRQGDCQMMGLHEHALYLIEFFKDQSKRDKLLEIKNRRMNRSFLYKIKGDNLYYQRTKGWPVLHELDDNIEWIEEEENPHLLFCTECGHPWRIKSCVDPKCKSTENRYEILEEKEGI